MVQAVRGFFQEVRTEMQKVTWSTREELIGSTAVVLVMMFILSAFIGLSDFILTIVISGFLR